MKEESVYIDNMPENTSYERMYKRLMEKCIDHFSVAWNTNRVDAYSEYFIIGKFTIAIYLLLPEDVAFSEYIEQKGNSIPLRRTFYYFLAHEQTCYCVEEKKEMNFQESLDLLLKVPELFEEKRKGIEQNLVKTIQEELGIKLENLDKYVKLNGFGYDFTSVFLDEVFGKIAPAQTICRYSSLQSFFYMLNNTSVRMCALPGMNDTSENTFAYNYIHEVHPGKQGTTNKRRKRILNENLILSFCEGKDKLDELTMWRLYGDDAKGVCCEYEMVRALSNEFDFRRTLYDDGSPKGKLRMMKKIYETIENSYPCFYVNYQKIYSFFKPAAYSIEKEIRLLYNVKDSNIKWYLTQDHSIVNACKDFPLNEFPLKLKRIILGSKMDGKETNLYQIKRMLECIASTDKKLEYLKNVQVELSSINCYR